MHLRQRLAVFVTNKFLKDVMKLSSFSVLGQIVTVAALPFITRLYTPEDFGNYSLLVTVVSLAGVIASGMYHRAVMVAHDEVEADCLVLLSLALAFFAGLLVYGLSYVLGSLTAKPSTASTFLLSSSVYLSTAVFLYVASQSLYVWQNRKKKLHSYGCFFDHKRYRRCYR